MISILLVQIINCQRIYEPFFLLESLRYVNINIRFYLMVPISKKLVILLQWLTHVYIYEACLKCIRLFGQKKYFKQLTDLGPQSPSKQVPCVSAHLAHRSFHSWKHLWKSFLHCALDRPRTNVTWHCITINPNDQQLLKMIHNNNRNGYLHHPNTPARHSSTPEHSNSVIDFAISKNVYLTKEPIIILDYDHNPVFIKISNSHRHHIHPTRSDAFNYILTD